MARNPSVVIGLMVILASCGGQVTSSVPHQSVAAEPTSTALEASATPIEGQPADFEVEVGGLSIAGHCTGVRHAGVPAVLMLHGLGGNQRQLARIEEHLADRARVCSYDRPGSDGDSQELTDRPRPVADVAAEARELLIALELDPPYFLVGHSAGGAIAAVFAHLYPEEIAGFVVSEPMPPYSAWRAINEAAGEPPMGMQALRDVDFTGGNPEGIDFTGNDVMLEPLPEDLPFAVLVGDDRSCGGFLEYCNAIFDQWQAMQASVADTGPAGRFIIVENSGHDIQESNPEAYRAAVDDVWADATD